MSGQVTEQDNREFHDVATTLLFENDRVKIWELALAPGEDTGLHRHYHDYVQVEIAGDKIRGVPEPDAEGTYTEQIDIDVEPGAFFYVEKGGVENAINIGEKPYQGILIELKD